jgi:hypothetical protein
MDEYILGSPLICYNIYVNHFELVNGGKMDFVDYLVSILVFSYMSGLAQGAQEVVKQSVIDGYKSLKNLLIAKSNNPQETLEAITELENKPEKGTNRLKDALDSNEIRTDIEIQKQFNEFLSTQGKPEINVFGGKVNIISGNNYGDIRM